MIISDERFENHVDSREMEYLRSQQGPKYLSLLIVIPITVVYVIIFISGIVGNIVTFIVIIKNPSMQTVTNYYLFNLAVSDVLFLIFGLPSELSVFWRQYPWKLGTQICKLRAYISETCSYVSVLTIVIFSVERYLAICHPLRRFASSLKRSLFFIFLAWLTALLAAIPFYAYSKVNLIEYPPDSKIYSAESATCKMDTEDIPGFPLYQTSCIVFFLLPMFFIAVLYVRMAFRIRKSSLDYDVEGSVHGETRQAQSRTIIIRMLGAVVISFFVCWAPFHAQRLLCVYETGKLDILHQWLYPISGCLYYLSTTVNPILYNVMSAKYRNAFKETLYCSSGHGSNAKNNYSNKESSTISSSLPRRGSQRVTNNFNCRSNVRSYQLEMTEREKGKEIGAERNDVVINIEYDDEMIAKLKKVSVRGSERNGRKKSEMLKKDKSFFNETRI